MLKSKLNEYLCDTIKQLICGTKHKVWNKNNIFFIGKAKDKYIKNIMPKLKLLNLAQIIKNYIPAC